MPIGMHVDGAVDVRPRRQYAAVQREAGPIDARGLVEVVIHADLDEIGWRHLGIEEFMSLDQKVALLARHPHGGVIVDDVAPAVVCDQPIGRGEVNAGLPLGRRYFRLRDSGKLDVRVHERASRG